MVETAGNASIDVAASSDTVYELLADLNRISEISPECYLAEWEEGSSGPEVGAKFRGYNQAGEMKWDAGCVIVAADPGREWAFEVPAPDGRATTWRYEIEATPEGCRVTESFDSPILDQEMFQKMNRHGLLIANIAQSLENLKAVAES